MKRIAVIGLGQFGYQIAVSLSQKGFEVLAIDINPEVIIDIKAFTPHAVLMDATDENAMRSTDIETVDRAIVAIGSNVQASLLTVSLLQRLDVKQIFVRAITPLQEKILSTMKIPPQNIINIEREMGLQLSNILSALQVERYIKISEKYFLIETAVPHTLVGKTLRSLHLRSEYGINVVGIKVMVPECNDFGEIEYELRMTDVFDPTYPLGKKDKLVIFGIDEKLDRFLSIEGGL